MKSRYGVLGLLLSVFLAAPAMAQDPFADVGESSDSGDGTAAVSSVPKDAWYVSPMFNYTLFAESRGLDNGIGGQIGIGKKVTDGMLLELTGFYTTADAEDGSTSAKLAGAGGSALISPFSSLPDLYAVLGLYRGQTKDHPGPIANFGETVFDAGIGYMYPITPSLLIRAEAKYRMDSHDRERAGVGNDNKPKFYDGVFSVGLLLPLGQKAPAPVEGADVVATNAGDSDNDGVPDDADKCPGTPAGAVVNSEGCEADADGDGVPDRLDKCADSPAGAAVNSDGCPMDTDGDGILDDADECPNSPAGAKVLQNGCALQGDCRKPRPGEQVDENGCAVEQKFILKGVKFEFDSDRLTEEAKTILVDVAATLQAYPTIKVELQGHTDNVGTDAYNQGLSERRANAVKSFLSGHSVDAERMSPVGYGEAQPIDTNDTEEGRDNNRRVELKVLE